MAAAKSYFLTLPYVHDKGNDYELKLDAHADVQILKIESVAGNGVWVVYFAEPVTMEEVKVFCPQAEWSPYDHDEMSNTVMGSEGEEETSSEEDLD